MSKLPRIPSVVVTRALKSAGFFEYHRTGSHAQFRNLNKPELRITIPFSKKDLAPKTLKSIIKQAGLTVEEFINLL